MAHLLGDVIAYLQFDDIDIDNWHFKLYYKGATVLFIMGSMVGVLSQYFGDPIECDFTTIDSNVASDYCWIHGSSYIPVEYQPHMKCIADLEGVTREDDAPDTSYYQWVVFMMALQASFFYAPYKMWSVMEGGLIESFGKDAKSAVMLSGDSKADGVAHMDTVVERFVSCFRSIFHHNQWYLWKFVACEALNMIFLFINFHATDRFLQGRFWYYGVDVIRYLSLTKAERQLAVSPFCATFPTEVSCTVPNIGAAGGEQHHNGMCVLSQNIINEKIYLVLWFYLTALCLVSMCFFLYRVSTLIFEPLRFELLYGHMGHRRDDEVRKALQFVLSKCRLGDWFVLSQLAKNVNRYFLREFVKALRDDMKDKPKKTNSSKAGKDSANKDKSNASTLRKRGEQHDSLISDRADHTV